MTTAWLLFLPACFALNAFPGPNNMTAFVNGARMPVATALIASLGRLPAFALLITITAVGLGAVLAASASALWVIKIVGALYLTYIGIRMVLARPAPVEDDGQADMLPLARQDFLIAISNPKAIAIFTAFFPQFLDHTQPVEPQILAMGGVFLALETVAAALYILAGKLMHTTVQQFGGFGMLQKGVGGFLVFSGVSMALSSQR